MGAFYRVEGGSLNLGRLQCSGSCALIGCCGIIMGMKSEEKPKVRSPTDYRAMRRGWIAPWRERWWSFWSAWAAR